MNHKPQNLPRWAAVVALLLGGVASPARAAMSVNPHGQFGGWPASIAVPPGGGNYVYSGEGSGLGVWDVTSKTNPAIAGGLPLGGTDVADIRFDATGQIAYVANGSGLQVISLADPDKPTLLGSLATSGTALSVAVVDATYVLVATSAGGNGWIRVVNVSDPANPADMGGYDTPGSAQHVVVAGTRAYVADGTMGLLVLDISTPATPTLLGSYPTLGSAARVQVVGTVAYVACGASGLHLLNVANPSNITLLATTETDSNVVDIQVAGTTAYTVDQNTGNLHVLNVASPAAPVRIANTDLGWDANRLAIGGNYAYVAAFKGLIIVDVTTPSNPTVVGAYERPSYVMGGTVAGTTAYLVDQSQLWVCSYATPSAPAVLGKCALGHTTWPWQAGPRVSVSGNTAVIAKGDYGMPIIAVSNPSNPTLAGRFAIPANTWANDVSVNGTLACLLTVSNSLGRLRLVDITNPASPTEMGALNTPGDGRRVAVLNNLAAVADGAGGVRLINIANPAAPVEAGHIDPPAGTTADLVTLKNDPTSGHPWVVVLFNASAGWRLQGYDVQNPAAPVFVNELTSATGHINDLHTLEGRAYLGGSLHLVDLETWTVLYFGANPNTTAKTIWRDGDFIYLLIISFSNGAQLYVCYSPEQGQLARVEVTPSDVTVRVGEQQQFSGKGRDANGNQVPVSGTWTSTGGTITQGGLYTAGTTAGDYNVTYTDTATGIQGTATVHVSAGELTRVEVTPGESNLKVGQQQTYTATGYDANNNQVPTTGTWTTTGGTITPSGQYTAPTTTGDQTVTYTDTATGIQGTATVHVSAGELTRV
ncbi:MAG: hypothetical protein FJ388_11795, partial [Verrucomicrobia bacterium]|nr:hypothetical protein [Verrucomicrobiota bacterium]